MLKINVEVTGVVIGRRLFVSHDDIMVVNRSIGLDVLMQVIGEVPATKASDPVPTPSSRQHV